MERHRFMHCCTVLHWRLYGTFDGNGSIADLYFEAFIHFIATYYEFGQRFVKWLG